MSWAGAAVLVAMLAALPASPAHGADRSIDVLISAHLRSDYRFTYDYVDTSDPQCPQTIRASSRVVTDMPTVRPAQFRITRLSGDRGYAFSKRLGGAQRAVRAIDMRADMTRSTQGGSSTPCTGHQPYPTVHCGSRSWALDGRLGIGRGQLVVSIADLPVYPNIQQVMKDDEWRDGGCGYDSTQADEYITQTRGNAGTVKSPYSAPIAVGRLFRPGRRTLRLRSSHTFSSGRPNQITGGDTEVRTVEVKIRKLR